MPLHIPLFIYLQFPFPFPLVISFIHIFIVHHHHHWEFTFKSCGINKEGNHYCNRDYGPGAYNQNSYHYSNLNGPYYYSNPNGSTCYNNGKGYSIYTPPGNSSSGSTQK